jgi:hypothetical protein
MGARTVAGEMVTVPIWSVFGTGFSNSGAAVVEVAELSQNLRIVNKKLSPQGAQGKPAFIVCDGSKESPRFGRGLDPVDP